MHVSAGLLRGYPGPDGMGSMRPHPEAERGHDDAREAGAGAHLSDRVVQIGSSLHRPHRA